MKIATNNAVPAEGSLVTVSSAERPSPPLACLTER